MKYLENSALKVCKETHKINKLLNINLNELWKCLYNSKEDGEKKLDKLITKQRKNNVYTEILIYQQLH